MTTWYVKTLTGTEAQVQGKLIVQDGTVEVWREVDEDTRELVLLTTLDALDILTRVEDEDEEA